MAPDATCNSQPVTIFKLRSLFVAHAVKRKRVEVEVKGEGRNGMQCLLLSLPPPSDQASFNIPPPLVCLSSILLLSLFSSCHSTCATSILHSLLLCGIWQLKSISSYRFNFSLFIFLSSSPLSVPLCLSALPCFTLAFKSL